MGHSRMYVAALSTTPVKGLQIGRPHQVIAERAGLLGDRRFYLVDDRARMVNGKHSGALNQIVAELDRDGGRLTLGFPGGEQVSAPVQAGETLEVAYRSDPRRARLVEGPFSAAISEHVGEQLRLVLPADRATAVDRGAEGAVTLVSQASVAALAAAAGSTALDPRRFRMSIEIAGAGAFEEDGWLGRELRIGGALIRPAGHVGRCIVTSRDPETGEVDVPTLEALRELRGEQPTTEPLALGVWGAVASPGTISVGDPVEIAD
ncbi:MAG: MOSC domain-containing protein [Solirubrobacteraceae bacterium]